MDPNETPRPTGGEHGTGADAIASGAARWETGYVESNGIDLHYYRTGSGKTPLVLAHGLTDDGSCWSPLAATFADEFDIVAYDARGHGLSSAPGSGYGINDRVDDLVGLLEALDLDDPILVGHSFGGNTVACTAAAYPDLPRALVLEDPAGMLGWFDDQSTEQLVSEMRDDVKRWHKQSRADLLASFEHEPWAEYLYHARREVSTDITQIRREGYADPSDTFPKIACPTFVLRADVDDDQRERDRQSVDHLQNGRLIHVDGAGHCIRRDAFATTVEHLRSFFDEL